MFFDRLGGKKGKGYRPRKRWSKKREKQQKAGEFQKVRGVSRKGGGIICSIPKGNEKKQEFSTKGRESGKGGRGGGIRGKGEEREERREEREGGEKRGGVREWEEGRRGGSRRVIITILKSCRGRGKLRAG